MDCRVDWPGLGLPVLAMAFFLMMVTDLIHAKGNLFRRGIRSSVFL